MTGDEEAADVQRVRAGDREAFGRLFDRHAAAVRSVVAAVSADFASTDDLTQETFLRAYRLINRLRDPADFGPWIRGIARRVARERRRPLRRDRHELVSELLGSESREAGPVERSSRREDTAMLVRYVAELPERERLALHAYYFHDQSVDSAAAVMGVSRSTFYTLLDRARESLGRRFASEQAKS